MSSIKDKFKTIVSGAKSLGAIAVNAATGVEQKVTPELQKERLNICRSCPYLKKPLEQCGKCLCLVNYKTMFIQEKCPEGKWEE